MTATHFTRLLTSAVLGLGLSALTAQAQPTDAQRDAIRSNCRSDFMSNCSGVTPGGAEALQCLQRNMSKLSSGCQGAVKAISPPPAAAAPRSEAPAPTAPAPAPTPAAAPAAAPAPAPAAPAPGRTTTTTTTTTTIVTTTAAAPATTAPASKPAATAPARTANVAPAAAPAPAARPAGAPTEQQKAAIRSACQSDFMAKCRGVQPGGAEAFQCLQRNSAQLAPACRSAVAAIGGGATAAPATAAAPAAVAPAAMPTAAQQNAIKMSCRGDFMANCRGVQPGGQDAFMCLQRNSARLSPDCKTALTAVTEGGAAPAATAAAAPAARPGPPPGPFPIRRAIRERMMSGQ